MANECDRPAFNTVMAATIPVTYDYLPDRSSRLVQAHKPISPLLVSGLVHQAWNPARPPASR